LASLLRSALLSLLVAAAWPASQPAPPARILFIGNSLTYSNDLPGRVCALARAAGRAAVCESVAKPDYSLEDHWHERDARRAIARGWDLVVLQQGPSALPESRVLLVDFATRFDAEIRKSGARTALYMVWPSRARRGDFARVSESYAVAAAEVEGLLLPVGDAWQSAWAVDAGLPLYGPDGLHPSAMGTYLASLVIYGGIFNEPAPAAPVAGITAAHAEILRRAADASLAQLKK
jgi:hypothetical protein